MFEEVVVWQRANSKLAMRYVGFRNLETGRVWIAFRNYIGIDEETDLSADELIAPNAILEYFLDAFPSDAQLWKPTISEALAIFIEKHPDA